MNGKGKNVRIRSVGEEDGFVSSHSSFIIHHSSFAFRHGFTFIELLAAMVFVAIVIPAAVHALTIANRAGIIADHKRVAVQLADKLLNEYCVTEEWRHGDETGDFADDWPGYRWALHTDAWSEDAMRVVSVDVFFTVQSNEYSVRLSTLAEETQQQ
jgi:prepilin-type N-terminal cleavage/methylation domain-containing protein